MGTYILTSMFPDGLDENAAEVFRRETAGRSSFAFIASEFEKRHEETDHYFHFFLKMFEDAGIHFEKAYVVDGRMTAEEAQKAASEADALWLAGGDTLAQFAYFQKYGLDRVIRQHQGLVIGMSAGSINLAEISLCISARGQVYHGLGCVNITVEPHFVREQLSEELLALSERYVIYGLCDDSLIVCKKETVEYIGEVYQISQRKAARMGA